MSPGLLPGAGCGLPAAGARRPVSRVGGSRVGEEAELRAQPRGGTVGPPGTSAQRPRPARHAGSCQPSVPVPPTVGLRVPAPG